MMRNRFLTVAPVCIFVCLASPSKAQVLDEIEVRQEGLNAIVQVKFVAPVQFLKSISARSNDLVQIFYAIRPTQDRINDVTSERRMAGGGAIPSLVLTDEADSSAQSGLNRRLVVRFSGPARFRTRPGPGDRSIELVLEGLGSSVRSVAASPRSREELAPSKSLALADEKYVVTLQSDAKPGQQLQSSVPASLQAFEVFTAKREKDGQVFYDTNLGNFSNATDASAALALAIGRFPGAFVSQTGRSTKPSGQQATGANKSEVNAENLSFPSNLPLQGKTETDVPAEQLLVAAQTAFDGGNYSLAIESLNQLLNLPPNASSRRAQELAGLARLNSGDSARAKAEFELFLKLYPVGVDSDKVRQLIAALPTLLPSSVQATAVAEPTSTSTGSLSVFYYGGKSDIRTQEFKDSILGGLPVLQSENTLSAQDQSQIQTNLDLSWRFRDTEKDMRFVFRDAYSADLLPKGVGKERLTALYFDYRSLTNGTSIRVGRQSPSGGGVLYRFDGITAAYAFKPKWKVSAVAGTPTDPLLDARRVFYGLSLDAEALTKELSGSVYVVEQVIDGVTDRRGLGMDLRYFSGGLSVTSQFDYDQILNAVNIASVQGNWQMSEATSFNAMIDRRTTPILTLGNVLFFQDPALLAQARRIQELLQTTPLETLREQVRGLTAYQNQARIGGTTVLTERWQTGADISVTSVDEIKPVVALLPDGQASTGNLWSIGAQLIGTNLYSARDTHVFNVSFLGGPTYRGTLLSYNNLSSLSEEWQLEPSLKYFTQTDNSGASNKTWTAGMRVVYRLHKQMSLESELTFEQAEAVGAASGGQGSATSTSRFNYYLGGRYDF